tara:strand:+ start:187 stop:900 length:714 start_codon:yes stop_codon:yes gene_type:complete
MAINIDRVYQKVLALTNKEQRGYLTPQEFNLIANKAQKDIYSNYFHLLKTAYHRPKNQLGVAFDNLEILQEKLHPFKTSAIITQQALDASANLPENLYSIDVILKNSVEITEMTKKEVAYTQNHPLTKATNSRMVYVREDNSNNGYPVVTLYPTPTVETTYDIHYYKIPTSPKWGYVIVNGKALYNSNTSVNFDLHTSEEENLVARTLELTGITIDKQQIQQAGIIDRAQIKEELNK